MQNNSYKYVCVAAIYYFFSSTLIVPDSDLKPDNILITLTNPEEAVGFSVVLSHLIIPFSSDELQNNHHILSDYKFKLTEFGLGE